MPEQAINVSRVVCDFILLLSCGIPLLIFQFYVTPYKRGFYCDDETIRYPHKKSTVGRVELAVVGMIIPTVLIIGTELFRAMAWERHLSCNKTYQLRSFNVHRLVVRLYCFIGYFVIGVFFNQLMVDIAKYTIGRQRPHFIDVCHPSVGYHNCTQPDTYITDFVCTSPNFTQKEINDSQLSFYSGHSAFSFYGATFISLYLQARLYRPIMSRLVLPVIQFATFAGASYVALTRVSDYKHHWSDVLVGSLMGTIIGVFVAVVVAEVFKRREIPIECSTECGLIRMERRDVPEVVAHAAATISNETDPVKESNQRLVNSSWSEHTSREISDARRNYFQMA